MKLVAFIVMVWMLAACAAADAGIFVRGQRYLFPWRRPDVVQPAPAPVPPPVLDPALVGPSPQDEKIDAAIEAVLEAVTKPEPEVVAAPEPEPSGGMPAEALWAIGGISGGGLGLRRIIKMKAGE